MREKAERPGANRGDLNQMLKPVPAVAFAAALAAFVIIAIPALVNASAPVEGQKADLADLSDCELRGWPYYSRTCVRDETLNAGRSVNVRVVAPDRIFNKFILGPRHRSALWNVVKVSVCGRSSPVQ